MIFIIIKNDNILNVCETFDNVYHNILSYIRIILYCDKNKMDFFNDLKIIEYINGYPNNDNEDTMHLLLPLVLFTINL